ncbi:unnamed protein product [Citrullus colocynthis]|uniref:Uncharacterized protein n=1 Tax=Citrullus colocynthis TaxID=252529 RepID=A0ABP0XWT7_9ROSI
MNGLGLFLLFIFPFFFHPFVAIAASSLHHGRPTLPEVQLKHSAKSASLFNSPPPPSPPAAFLFLSPPPPERRFLRSSTPPPPSAFLFLSPPPPARVVDGRGGCDQKARAEVRLEVWNTTVDWAFEWPRLLPH